MAAGGMGDVLTGMIAGLLAQGYDASGACRLGVFLHGASADTLSVKMGPMGFLASEVMDQIPSQWGRLLSSLEA
jgi:NAD(P)H-hydrate epimerase